MTAVQYRDEILDPIVNLYAAAVGRRFILMEDNECSYRTAIIVHVWSGQLIRQTLIRLKIFGMPSVMLYVYVSLL